MQYVCLKLSDGDEVFATLTDFTDPLKRVIEVIYPMALQHDVTVDDLGRMSKVVKLAPYFPFASDRIFRLNTAHIIHINPLSEKLVDTYKTCVEGYNRMETEEPAESPESVSSVDIELDDDNTSDTFYIEGNDTIQ